MVGRHGIQVEKRSTKLDDNLEVGGDYILREIVLHNYYEEKTDILPIVQELNIYESIYNNAITGTVIVGDTKNQIARMKLQGLERISFKVTTPGQTGLKDSIDFSRETGDPLHVYKITDRKMVNNNLMVYKIHFASREFMRNTRLKVSQAYTGTLDNMVHEITKDYLDSKKTLFVETTSNQDKIVIPNMRPFDAINMIAKKAIPQNSRGGVGYYFYETTKGFHFRSYENMTHKEARSPREPKMIFTYNAKKIVNVPERTFFNERSIDKYVFMKHFDSAAMQSLGVYSQNVIYYNFYNKEIQRTNWKFHHHWEDLKHTDDNIPQLNDPVDVDPKEAPEIGDKGVGDYISSKTTLLPTTRYAHGENTGAFGDDPGSEGLTEAKRNFAYKSLKNNVLQITIKGHANLQSGDMIQVDIPPIDRDKTKRKDTGQQFDDHHSGKYIITAIHHKIIKEQYLMICECVKDGVREKYKPARLEYSGQEEKEGSIIDQYILDKKDI